MGLTKDLKSLVGKRLLGVGSGGEMYFEGGTVVEPHQYETYVSGYLPEHLNPKRIPYYSPKLFEKDSNQ